MRLIYQYVSINEEIMKTMAPSYWVTNTSPMNVSLADLNLTIKAFSSVNLLDKKHYKYTIEQLNKSVESGSIFKKRDRIVVRKNIPSEIPEKLIGKSVVVSHNTTAVEISINKETAIPSRERSLFSIKEENYEELNITTEDQKAQDEIFAKEVADLADPNDPTKKV